MTLTLTIAKLLPQGFTGTVLFHTMAWFQRGKGAHRDVGYSSDDQTTVDTQLDLILKYGTGVPASQLGVIVDWYGPKHTGEPWLDHATLMLLARCEKRGMKFSLCFDQGISRERKQQDMVDAFTYAQQKYFPSPAFTRDENGTLFVTDFAANYVDWAAISQQFSVRICRWKNDKVNGYAWIKPGSSSHASLIADNANVYMPCVCAGFNDTGSKDTSKGVWGNPIRKADYENGLLWLTSWVGIPAAARFVQVVTLNDHEERTGVLGNLGFPGLPSDVILPVGFVIPNVFNDPLPGPPLPPPLPGPPSRAEFDDLEAKVGDLVARVEALENI